MARPIFLPPVDFQRVLIDLQARGMTGPQIQALTGIRRSTLSGYKAGSSTPDYKKGEALVALWCQRTGGGRKDLPRTDRVLSAAKVEAACRVPAAFNSTNVLHAAQSVAAVTRLWAKPV